LVQTGWLAHPDAVVATTQYWIVPATVGVVVTFCPIPLAGFRYVVGVHWYVTGWNVATSPALSNAKLLPEAQLYRKRILTFGLPMYALRGMQT